jgi:hypothetical protein
MVAWQTFAENIIIIDLQFLVEISTTTAQGQRVPARNRVRFLCGLLAGIDDIEFVLMWSSISLYPPWIS